MKPTFEDTQFISYADGGVIPWWAVKKRTSWMLGAANAIKLLWEDGAKLNNKVKQLSSDLASSKKALRDSELVTSRVAIALAELERAKGPGVYETAYVVVLSPYQYELISMQGFQDVILSFKKHPKIAQYAGLMVVTAKGFSGPAVMTEDAFNAFSRNSPELQIQRKMR